MIRRGAGEVAFWLWGGLALALWVGFVVLLVALGLLHTDIPSLLLSLRSGKVLFALKLSLLMATGATLLSFLVSLPAAYLLSRRDFPGKRLLDALLDLLVVFPPVAAGFLLLIFFDTPVEDGLERLLETILGEPDFRVPLTPWAIVPAQFTIVCGLCMRVLKSTFDSISPRLRSDGQDFGVRAFEGLRQGGFALGQGGILAAGVLAWARAIREFGATITLAGAMRMETEALPITIYLSLSVADIRTATAVSHLSRRSDDGEEAWGRVPVVNGVERGFGVESLTVRSVLRLREGPCVAILGPSGAGKTTLIEAIAGLVRPFSGRIVLDGRDMTDLLPEERRVGVW